LNDATKEHGKDSAEAREAQVNLTKAQRDATGSALDVTSAMAALNDAVAENPALLGDSKAQLQTWVTQGLISAETAAFMEAQLDDTADAAVRLGRTDPNVAISETGGARTQGQLSRVQQAAINAGRQRPNVHVTTTGVGSVIGQLNRIPRNITVRVNARMGQTVSGAIGGPTFHEGGYVGGRRGEEVAAILQAGERVLSLSEVDAMSRGVPVAGGGGGGTNIYLTVDARGSLNPNSQEIASLVASGLRQAGELGIPLTLRGRSL
jgi:hypothetical protein